MVPISGVLAEFSAATAAGARRAALARAGVTLVELMVALAIISVGVLGMVGAFKYFNVGIQSSKTRSLANNIAQERIEYLKNKSYYRVLVTTQTATDNRFSPGMEYDVAPNGEDTVNIGGLNFIRRVYIRKVNENSSGNLTYLSWNAPDPGLKEIKVYVGWYERGEWRKLEVRNLRENPARVNQSATINGWVREGAVGIEGAIVRAQENPSQYAETDVNGNYAFTIEPGTYTLLASKEGYFPGALPSFGLPSGGTAPSKDFLLTRMSSGTITGTAWLRDHLVISQVVGSSVNSSGQYQEWVEVYNPTTWTWTMGTGLGTASANRKVIIAYTEAGEDDILPNLDYRRTSMSPSAYFLFANTGTITAAGVSRTADAVYSTDADFNNIDDMIQTGSPSSAGFLNVIDLSPMRELDWVGWEATSNSDSDKKNPPRYEGAPIAQSIGLQPGEEYVRKTVATTSALWHGRCYDTNNNENDFEDHVPLTHPPHYSYDSDPCDTGTPAEGTLVFADDSLSSPVNAASDGSFNLVSVATGSWTVYLSSGIYFSSTAYFGGTVNSFVSSVGSVRLSSLTAYGYVSGRVTNTAGTPISGIKMFSAGSLPVNTDTAGKYTLAITTGLATVIANYGNNTPNYVEISSMDISVELGGVVKDVDFALYYGGKIRGKITTNGVDPLPNIPVVGLKDGVEQGSGISGADGYFLIAGSGISTGTYSVIPQLEAGETSNPSSTTVLLTAGAVAFASTYTVSGAFGYINGSVHTGSAAGPAITTGVLIYISTASLTAGALPPDITPALRASTGIWYAASSNALGNFSVAVKGGYTYNVYAWYTTWSGSTPSPARKDTTAAVSPNQTVTVSFFW